MPSIWIYYLISILTDYKILKKPMFVLNFQAATTVASDLSFFAALAISTLTKALNAQPILNITVYDYLWGYEDHLVKLASNIVPSFITFEKLGLLDRVSGPWDIFDKI